MRKPEGQGKDEKDPRSAINELRAQFTNRLNTWWIARRVFMPAACDDTYPHEARVEDIKHLLPSSYTPEELISYDLADVAALERRFREVQAHEALAELRFAIKRRAAGVQQVKSQKGQRGQRARTRMEKRVATLHAYVDLWAEAYRRARRALLSLGMDPADDTFQALKDADYAAKNMGDGWENVSLGEGKRVMSWIWTVGRDAGVTETSWSDEADRVLWFRARARRDRWKEEVETLEAEINRMSVFFQYFAKLWDDAVVPYPATTLELGRNAYCYKMREMYNRLDEKTNAGNSEAFLKCLAL
ncbi:hypothetical protein BOTBODRAFT_298992 [Botryobasidium botryosum FD-172 SS1]|uniref:Uncharacterized protein n=1 Tax=Botryobasidium botryosum (strain FD-172 SS1) TaxID=930990 RepID=A0A067M1J9_BOTB1|nr:hypothetical protein BOTBODRAFT_298992 [Botryobasidium botryosum FD-172 SS1]